MKKLIPYLIIYKQCEKALEFYKKCFDGKITFQQKYAETAYEVSDEFKDKIAHAEFKADLIHFYASDGFDGKETNVGDNVAMSINFSEQLEQKKAFEQLKVGGQVIMEFSATSANSTLATLIDKFGIHWYLNFEHTK
ncbi:MAG: VOC family protein [Thermonemataceae bacterium]